MNDNTLVSIIVPLYNHEKYFPQTLESIIAQDYGNIELVIVNDGSTDNSDDVVQRYYPKLQKRCKNFQYLSTENGGVCKALNLAASKASGEFLLLCSSDDIMLANRARDQLQYMRNNPMVDLLFSNGYQVSDNSFIDIEHDIDESKLLTSIFPELSSSEFGEFDWMIDSIAHIPSPSFFCSRSFFQQQLGFDEELAFEDVDFYLRASDTGSCHFDSKPVFIHRLHGDNTGRKFEEVIAPGMFGMAKRYEREERFSTPAKTEKVLEMLYKTIAILPQRIFSNMKNKVIIAWGIGGYLDIFKRKNSIEFEYLVDSDLKKQGTYSENKKILPPSTLKQYQSGDVFIVITSQAKKEISTILDSWGFIADDDYY